MSTASNIKAAVRIDNLGRHISNSAMSTSHLNTTTWRAQFLGDVMKMPMPTFSLATLHPNSLHRPSGPCNPAGHASGFVPRVRTVVFRGMWASLPTNERNPAPLNDPVYESDMPTFTTDARMEKVAELGSFVDGKSPQSSSRTTGSGGGGPVEAVFWVPDSMTQWRVRGGAYILAPDIETEKGKVVRDSLCRRMRQASHSAASDSFRTWSWNRELTAHFGNLSPKMRGSFRDPPPGTPRTTTPKDPRLGLGQEVTDLEDEVAREHFRVVVIVPDEVDQVYLEGQRRWLHRYFESDTISEGKEEGNWETSEVWP